MKLLRHWLICSAILDAAVIGAQWVGALGNRERLIDYMDGEFMVVLLMIPGIVSVPYLLIYTLRRIHQKRTRK